MSRTRTVRGAAASTEGADHAAPSPSLALFLAVALLPVPLYGGYAGVLLAHAPGTAEKVEVPPTRERCRQPCKLPGVSWTIGSLVLLIYRSIPPRVPSERPPLLLLLHGIGADEEDLLPLAQLFDPRVFMLSVRAPHEAEPMGYRWYAIDWSVTPPRANPDEIVASRDLFARFVEEAIAATGADPSRVFLFGFSQGAIMSLALLLARPDLVRGVVAHSGRLTRLPGPEPKLEALSRAEVLLLHGAQDDVVPIEQGEKAYQVLQKLVGSRVTYQAFDQLGHGVSKESAAAAAEWLGNRIGI